MTVQHWQDQRPGQERRHAISRRSAGDNRRRGEARPDGGVMGFDAEAVATGLGWFSVGLGLAELFAPRTLARAIGVRHDDRNCLILQAFGIREIASGVGILTRPRPAGWVWSRVAGDAMDLSFLRAQLTSDHSDRERVTAAAAAVIGVAILDVLTGERLSASDGDATDGRRGLSDGGGRTSPLVQERRIRVVRAISVNKPVDEVYRFWRDFENFPRFLSHVEEVRKLDGSRSHWKVKAPLARTVEWDSEVIEDRPGERIAWRSAPGADVENSGVVSFSKATGDRGTAVRLELGYDPPAGIVGATIARLFGREPGQQVDSDLRRLKALLEVGEIVQSEATAKGWGAGRPPKELPARRP